jgi:hypothetical protein
VLRDLAVALNDEHGPSCWSGSADAGSTKASTTNAAKKAS